MRYDFSNVSQTSAYINKQPARLTVSVSASVLHRVVLV